MYRLAWAFADRTNNIVGNRMSRLILSRIKSHATIFNFRKWIQWATLVTHHFLRPCIFSQKYGNRTFSMIIYLLTFYLFDDIEKKYRNLSCELFCFAKGNFDKSARLHVQSERLYFLFAFCARHYPWWSLWPKNTNNNYFIQVNPIFLVVGYCLKKCSFWRHINVSYNNQTDFPS